MLGSADIIPNLVLPILDRVGSNWAKATAKTGVVDDTGDERVAPIRETAVKVSRRPKG